MKIAIIGATGGTGRKVMERRREGAFRRQSVGDRHESPHLLEGDQG